MSGPNPVEILGIPEYLHDAMKDMTYGIARHVQSTLDISRTQSDMLAYYGHLVDAMARYVNDAEERIHVTNQAVQAAQDLARAGAAGDAERATGGAALVRDAEDATDDNADRPLGSGDVAPLHDPVYHANRTDRESEV